MIAEGYKDTEIGVIPIEWEVVKLETICDVRDGTHDSPKYIETGIPFITSKHLTDKGVDFSDVNYISNEDHINFSKRSLVENGDILFGMIGTIGKPLIANYDFEFSIKNIALLKFKDNTQLNNSFTLNLLKSTIIDKQFSKLSNGGVQSFIALGMIRSLKIPLPPLKEQEKIADILSTADHKIDAIQIQIDRAEKLKKGLLQKLLSEGIGHSEFKDSELGKIPDSWEVVKLSDVCKFKQGMQISIEEQDTKQNNDQIRFLRISDYTQNTGDIRYVSKDYSNYIISENDVVMVRYGETAGFIGRGFSGVLANNLFTINPDYRMSKDYLYVYLSQDSIYNYLKNLRAAGAMPAVSFKSLDIIKMPVPSIEEQQTIATISESCDEKLVILHKKLDKYRKLKAGLLQQLLTGKVRVEI